LFESRAGSGVFSEDLDLKASFALGTFATVFQAEVYTIMACSDYYLRQCMTVKTICICLDIRAFRLALLWNLQKRAVDLRLVFNENLIMGCILDPISGPRAGVF
jgi:hypothetical protein